MKSTIINKIGNPKAIMRLCYSSIVTLMFLCLVNIAGIYTSNAFAQSNDTWLTITETSNGDGNTCDSSISPTSATFFSNGTAVNMSPKAAGSGEYEVRVDNCDDWTAQSNAPWITVTETSKGDGNTFSGITFSVNSWNNRSSNTGKTLTGTITIAGKTFTVLQYGGIPTTVIKANDSDSTITVGPFQPINISIFLDSGMHIGHDADWWVAASTPDGLWYNYRLGIDIGSSAKWIFAGSSYTNLSPTYQGALGYMNTSYLNTPGLPRGTYTFYFAIDIDMNGILDLFQTNYGFAYDSIIVNVK